jgi:hypothetical protein
MALLAVPLVISSIVDTVFASCDSAALLVNDASANR